MDIMMEAMGGKGSSATFVRTDVGEEFLNKAVAAGYMTTRPPTVPENTAEEVYIAMNPGAPKKKWANPLKLKYRQKYGLPVPRVD